MRFFRENTKIDTAMIDTSSKISLKLTCLNACAGDVERATVLYNFLADGIADMPDYTQQPQSKVQQLQAAATSAFSWLKENKDELLGAYQFIQQLRGNATAAATTTASAAADLPPIPKM